MARSASFVAIPLANLLWVLCAAMAAAEPANLLPLWAPTYEMHRSTVVQPCNWTGLLDADEMAKWGIVSVDWSTARAEWAQGRPMDCDERLLAQAAAIKKASGNSTRVFTYRNIVKALPWFRDVREKIADPAYAAWFLPFKSGEGGNYSVSPCTAGQGCSALYHDQLSTPQDTGKEDVRKGFCNSTCDCGGVPCGEYLFDHRNVSMSNWLIQRFLLGPTALGHPLIDGYFLDDVWSLGKGSWGCAKSSPYGGPSEMSEHCVQDTGLTADAVRSLQAAWHTNYVTAKAVAVAAGGFEWHLLHSVGTPEAGAQCVAFFRSACAPHSTEYDSALMVTFANTAASGAGRAPNWREDLATFLLIRGPFAWIGHGFSTCSLGAQPIGGPGQLYERPPALDVDYGAPLGLCTEDASGVFRRSWSRANVSFDCATGIGSISR